MIVTEPVIKKTKAELNDFSQSSNLRFNIFACLWAIATLFHLAHSSTYDIKLHYALLSIVAMFILFSTLKFKGLLCLIALQIYSTFYEMPNMSNHWLFTTFVNLTIIQALIFLIFKKKTLNINKGELLEMFAPVLRIELIIMYFFVVFLKLNSHFFIPDVSCATALLHTQILPPFIELTPLMFKLNAYFTIFIELLIPTLLIFKRTRNWGLLIGLVFHCLLAYNTYNAYADYSSMVFALYFLFISPQFSANAVAIWRKFKTNPFFAGHFSFPRLFMIAGALFLVFVCIHVLTKILVDYHEFNLYFFWTGFSIIFIGLFISYMFKYKSNLDVENHYFKLPHLFFIIIPALVFLNGICPFLGLKTENSFSMFSNLRTEGGISNHYIMPVSFQIFDYQKDLIEITSSSDPYLQKSADENKLMVFSHFQSYVEEDQPERVEYIHHGKKQIYLSEGKSSEKVSKNSYLFRKTMGFRFINKYDPQPCGH